MCVNEDKILRMKDLIKTLTEADIAYYRDDDPVMSDREYDQLTDELLRQYRTEKSAKYRRV